jgi:hypothetical protein
MRCEGREESLGKRRKSKRRKVESLIPGEI